MLDFGRVFRGETTIAALTDGLGLDDLRTMTDESLDLILSIIAGATDADVVFVPSDPAAHDAIAPPEAQDIGWTLGHIVVHATATSEEGAALAVTLARGVEVTGRSRYETPWEEVTTIAQVEQRLAESRRMRHALLGGWPDAPHLDNTDTPIPTFGPMNAVARYALALGHELGHLDQLRDVVRQAKAARGRD